MQREPPGLDSLSRWQRHALRDVLVRSVVSADHSADVDGLAQAVRAAPIDRLPEAARTHRLSGAVLRGLGGVGALPASVRDELAADQRAAKFRHLVVIGALDQIGCAFDAMGLSWAVMKGPVLASLLYTEVGDRTSGDLDLLVERRDFGAAMRILEALGYAHDIRNWSLAESMLACAVGMATPMVQVDLHWHLHYSRDDRRQFALDPEAMLGRARRVVLSGAEVPTLDPVDTLLTLGFHAARSGGHRLIWMKDVERCVAVESPDVDELVKRCRVSRCGQSVGLILDRSRRVIGLEGVEDVVDALATPALLAADRAVCAVVDPIQFHDHETAPQWLMRSARSSAVATVAALPPRGLRSLHRRFFPPPLNETDDPDEKASYLRAVATEPAGVR